MHSSPLQTNQRTMSTTNRYCFILVLLGVIVLCLDIASASPVERVDLSDNRKQIYCGRKLSTSLAIICRNVYNRVALPSSGIPEANGEGRRSRRGVADECCHKPCNLDTLALYCSG